MYIVNYTLFDVNAALDVKQATKGMNPVFQGVGYEWIEFFDSVFTDSALRWQHLTITP